MSVTSYNNYETLTPLQSKPHVQESLAREGASIYGVIGCLYYEEFKNKKILNKVCLAQQSSKTPSGMPSHEGYKGEKG